MADENPYTAPQTEPQPGSVSVSAYCQDCGRPLTSGTIRRVAGGVYCTPCAAQLSRGGAAWHPVAGNPYAGARQTGPAAQDAGRANPVLAGLLGAIPGVGAMYNAQYAKAAMHLIVFVVLLTLADNLNWVFYWLVWGWVFYQIFDAYHTARARRDGLPLPNPFGWNEVGERLGFHVGTPTAPMPPTGGAAGPRSPAAWSGGFVQGVSGGSPEASTPNASASGPAYGARYSSTPFCAAQDIAPETDSSQPASDNPYTAPFAPPFSAAGAPPPPISTAPQPPGVTSVPYIPTYTGGQPVSILPPAATPSSCRRFPVGAIWLIILGGLFLLGNLLPQFSLNGRWLVPVLLLVSAVWSGIRRLEQFRHASLTLGATPNLANAMTGPAVLLSLAGLMSLQAARWVSLGRSWPVLLLVTGTMLLAQRATTPRQVYVPPPIPEPLPAPPVRSTSGTGSLGL